jgi:integrase
MTPSLRIRVDLDRVRQPLSSQNLSNAPAVVVDAGPRPDPKKLQVKVGTTALSFRYNKTRWTNKATRRVYTAYTLCYHDGLKPRREKRATFAALKTRAEEIALSIVNGETARLQLTPADQASFLRSRELAARTGIPLEILVGNCVEAMQIAPGVSPQDMARFHAAHHAGVKPCNAAAIVKELFDKRSMCSKWKRNLKIMLDRFAERFTGPLTALTARDLDDWLDSLKDKREKKLGLRSRRNYRDAVTSLVAFAKSRGYVARDWNVLADVSDPEPKPVDVQIYSPDELVRLLNKAESHVHKRTGARPYEKLVPFIAITAFAGVRHGEMNEEKVRVLDWSDFDFESRCIYIARGAAKTGADRVVDMPDNLVEWLQPYRKAKGQICAGNTADALSRLRTLAGIAGNKKNALRKSFISYKLALTRSIDGVADQAGNSAGVIRKNYKRSDTGLRAQAARWFAIRPVRADVLPLFQLAAKRNNCSG